MKQSPRGHWAIYNRDTGEIVKTIKGTRRLACANLPANHRLLSVSGNPGPGARVVDGELVPAPSVTPEVTYADLRREAILDVWPIDRQLEAFTEAAAGRPEKMAALSAHIQSVKDAHPKPEVA